MNKYPISFQACMNLAKVKINSIIYQIKVYNSLHINLYYTTKKGNSYKEHCDFHKQFLKKERELDRNRVI